MGLALWMDRVLEECDRVSVSFAPDPVHDLRVALRRCRSVADGVMAIDPDPAWKQMKKAGRELFRSLGALRDVHIMQDWTERLAGPGDPVAEAVLQHLQESEIRFKEEAAAALLKFDRKQWKKWGTALPRRAAKLRPGSNVFQHVALERWTQAHDLHLRALRNRSKVSFHSLRIGLKRFRYIVENFLPQQHALWSNDLKELQDLLGEVHDLDVLWTTLLQVGALADVEARSRWRERIVGERNSRIDEYRGKMVGKGSLWSVWRSELPSGKTIRAIALQRLKLWAAALDPNFKRSLHVTKLALKIYDGLRGTSSPSRRRKNDLSHRRGLNVPGHIRLSVLPPPLRGASGDPRTILQVAALLHDVGLAKRRTKSHKATYKLIEKLDPPLGFDREDLHLAAVISRYHRGALPRSTHIEQQWLAPADRQLVLMMAGILRLADALDAERDGRIQGLRVERRDEILIIFAQGYSPRDRIALDIALARHLLELACKCPVMIKTMRQKPAKRSKIMRVGIVERQQT